MSATEALSSAHARGFLCWRIGFSQALTPGDDVDDLLLKII